MCFAATARGSTGGDGEGGLWAGVDPFDQLRAGPSPRCVKIFAMPSGCSMNASIRMVPPQRGQTSGSVSETCVMRLRQAQPSAAPRRASRQRQRPHGLPRCVVSPPPAPSGVSRGSRYCTSRTQQRRDLASPSLALLRSRGRPSPLPGAGHGLGPPRVALPRGAGRRPSSDSPPACAVLEGMSPIFRTAQGYRTRCSPAFGMCAVSAASQSHAENTSKFRFSTGCILDR